MKFDNQLRYAVQIVSAYKGEMPLHAWLKNFFRENKQMGSRDRKLLSSLAYAFYRLGHAAKELPAEERILAGLFLCNDTPHELLHYFRPQWNEHSSLPLEEKIAIFRKSFSGFQITDIFPWKEELSEGIDHAAFCLSFLRQPDLFLRIRPGRREEVMNKLARQPEVYAFIPPFTLRLPNGFKVETLFTPDREIVVQDYSSQRIAPFLQQALAAGPGAGLPAIKVWDACAASGGKSILAYDIAPDLDLTVSDIRESILHNLKGRFARAGIKKFRSFARDLAAGEREPAADASYQLIIADLPCSGSGTWSRTPEELYFFEPRKISRYSGIQKKIVSNLIPQLQKAGSLLYITCSVFKKENEEMTAFIRQSFLLQEDRMELIKGYEEKADSMFAARFVK
jgi:16S rRNA (cytosine967-C5)-methyltransferase